MIRRYFLGIALGAVLTGCGSPAPTPDATYYLVRHAEKTTDKKDPALTEAGTKRAQDLAVRLKDVPLSKIYSSDYIRTRDTAAPIAGDKNLDVVIYNPRDLEGMSKNLLTETGHILVVGHSNTTPDLSKLLGGDAGAPIIEATEYDRLYILKRYGSDVSGDIFRYGEKS